MGRKDSGWTWVRKLALCLLAALIPAFCAPAEAYAAPAEQVSVSIPVTYTAEYTDVGLECRLEYEETAGQTVENDTLSLESGEEGSFTLTYTEPGTYYCTLCQVKGSAENVIYDEQVINVTIYVTSDTAGKLYADVVLYEDGSDKLPSACFTNRAETVPTPETTSESEPEAESTPEPSETADQTEETDSVKTADTMLPLAPLAALALVLLAALAGTVALIARERRM